jgi:V-type H+-transporting ATPase subunit a
VIEQTERLKEMYESFMTMLDYEKVLETVKKILPKLQTGQLRQSMHGGAHEIEKGSANGSLNGKGKEEEKVPLIDGDVFIAHIAGTIEVSEKDRLKKLLFRATRGKALTIFEDYIPQGQVDDQKPKSKTVYTIVFQEGRQIREKITRICDSFMGQRFDLPPFGAIQSKIEDIKRNIAESKQLTENSRKYLKNYLIQINQIQQAQQNVDHMAHDDVAEKISTLEVYKWFVAKEKALYHAMNMMKSTQSSYVGYFWSPTNQEHIIRDVLQHYSTTEFKPFNDHTITPPTFIKTNDYTWVYQEIVNTYGIPQYKEFNPAVFACVTFPFLFGVMFGDMGHGGLLFAVGILMIMFNNTIKKISVEASLLRYLITLMGFFAFFNGFIYNEFFAIPIDFFGSCYTKNLTIVGVPIVTTHTDKPWEDPSAVKGYLRHTKIQPVFKD